MANDCVLGDYTIPTESTLCVVTRFYGGAEDAVEKDVTRQNAPRPSNGGPEPTTETDGVRAADPLLLREKGE